MDKKPGRRSPLLLSPVHNLWLFGLLFASYGLVLAALLWATSEHKEALERIAQLAVLDQERKVVEEAVAVEAERGQGYYEPPIRERDVLGVPASDAIRVSVPTGWRWKGCTVEDGYVEVQLGPHPTR